MAQQAQHTPDSFIASDFLCEDGHRLSIVRSDNKHEIIAVVFYDAQTGEDPLVAEYRATVFAAAPELLAALTMTQSWIEKHNLDKAQLIDGNFCEVPMLTIIKKAIAKATNQKETPAGNGVPAGA